VVTQLEVRPWHFCPCFLGKGPDDSNSILGGLSAMSVLHARNSNKPLPGGVILLSPLLDLQMDATLHSPAMAADFLITFAKDNPILVDAFLPEGMDPSDPQVSPSSRNYMICHPNSSLRVVQKFSCQTLIPGFDVHEKPAIELNISLDSDKCTRKLECYPIF
jgi:hypothetical protein